MHVYRQQPYTQTPTGTHNLELLAVAAASGRADTPRPRMQSRVCQDIARPPTLTPIRRRTSKNADMPSQAPPTVVVKQPLSVKPFCGQSGWKSFKEHFMHICKINEWHDAVTRVNHLTIALERPAAEILRDIDEKCTRCVGSHLRGIAQTLWSHR